MFVSRRMNSARGRGLSRHAEARSKRPSYLAGVCSFHDTLLIFPLPPHILSPRLTPDDVLHKPQYPPHVREVAGQPQTDPDDTEFSSNESFKVLERNAFVQFLHVTRDSQNSRCASGVAHTTGSKGDFGGRCGIFDERIRDHLARWLRKLSEIVEDILDTRPTERNMRETVEAVSACSPIALSRELGLRDRMRTTGRPVESCLIFSSDETRYVVRQESLRGRNGI